MRVTVSHASGRSPQLDELDLVAVRVLDEGDVRRAVLHRARLARDLRAALPERVAGRVEVVDAERDVDRWIVDSRD
jgi:hypothetical protein